MVFYWPQAMNVSILPIFPIVNSQDGNCERHPGLEPGTSALGVPRATIAPEPQFGQGVSRCIFLINLLTTTMKICSECLWKKTRTIRPLGGTATILPYRVQSPHHTSTYTIPMDPLCDGAACADAIISTALATVQVPAL